MKIKVVEQIIRKDGYEDVIHKYLPFEYCCEKLKHTKYIELTDELISYCSICKEEDRYDCENNCDLIEDERRVSMSFYYDDTYPEPWEDYYNTDTYFIPLDYCPFCGDKIEVEIVKRENITDKYLELDREYEEIHKKWMKCDSIKRRTALDEERNKCIKKMNELKAFGEYQEN